MTIARHDRTLTVTTRYFRARCFKMTWIAHDPPGNARWVFFIGLREPERIFAEDFAELHTDASCMQAVAERLERFCQRMNARLP